MMQSEEKCHKVFLQGASRGQQGEAKEFFTRSDKRGAREAKLEMHKSASTLLRYRGRCQKRQALCTANYGDQCWAKGQLVSLRGALGGQVKIVSELMEASRCDDAKRRTTFFFKGAPWGAK